MYNLYFYKFNNYFNRTIKRYETKEEYDQYGISMGSKTANFMFADGVNTQETINIPQWNAMSGIPDYALLVDPNSEDIISRWFVIEASQNSGGQYDLYLRRDLVADFQNVILQAPAFIEKATLKTTDPLIWNSENMTFNQIKKAEIELKDKTQTPWIVGYYALPNPDEDKDESSGPVSVGIAEYDIDATVAGITNYNYYEWTEKPYYYLSQAEFQVNAWVGGSNSTQYYFFPQASTPYYTSEPSDDLVGQRMGKDADKILEYLVNTAPTNMEQEFINTVKTIDGISLNELNTLKSESYKVIKDTITNKIYKINLTIEPVNRWSKPREDIKNDNNYNTVYVNSETAVGRNDTNSPLYAGQSQTFYQYNIVQQKVIFSLDEITPTTGHNIDIARTRRTLNDAPYCMFAIPYGELDIIYTTETSSSTFRTNKANALTIGSGLLANKSDFVYDVQILPFCPIEKIRRTISNNTINLNEFVETTDYTTSAFAIKQVIFWAETSQGSIDLSVEHMTTPNLTPEQLQDLIINKWAYNYNSWTPEEAKVVNECSMYRLCSPNYASTFEYNLAKNGGINSTDITQDPIIFHVDYGYKPYTPYIKVSPIFGGLYGTNYNDARGLILSGDFSITATTDRWQQYQLQNKNYQLAFDRQIENMEVQHKYAKLQDIIGAITEPISRGISGGASGFMLSGGNPILAGVGAGIGATIGGITGTVEAVINQNLRNEALDYTKDQFGFALGNIQALPHTLNKVSAINPNFRYFPILEIYDATEEEKNALKQKLKYNGMTVGRINTIEAYIQEKPTYIKAQLIRMEDIIEDTHVLNEIANELYKGVYI